MTDGEADESVTRRGFLLGSAGVVAAGAAGTASAQESSGTSTSGGESGGNKSSGGGGGGPTKTVKVGPGGDLTFSPDKLTVTPGTTVKWVWESNGHNVKPESVPDGASWEGSAGGENKLYDKGHTYSHTFNTNGEFAYYCAPHKTAGMTGSITVGAATGPAEPAVPSNAKTLGLATSGALAFTLGLGYFFMKFGGDYGENIE